MASRFCCAEECRSDSPPLPNARVSPVRTQQSPVASVPYAPLGTGPYFPSLRTTDLNDLRAIFENATAEENSPEVANSYFLRDLYTSPRKAPIPPQRSVSRQLRKKLSKRSINSSLIALAGPKRKTQPTKENTQSASLAPRNRTTLEPLLSDMMAHGESYDQDATEFQIPRKHSLRTYQPCPELPDCHAIRNNHHSVMHSFEWMGPLFDGHHHADKRHLPIAATIETGDVLLLPSPRPSSSVPNLLAASDLRRRRSPARSSRSESDIHNPNSAVTKRTSSGSRPKNTRFWGISTDCRPRQKHHRIGDLYSDISRGANDTKDARKAMHQECHTSHHSDPRSQEPASIGNSTSQLATESERIPSAAQRFRARLDSNFQLNDPEKLCQPNILYSDVDGLPLINCTSQGSSGTSFHLQNMEISQRLRSSSNASDNVSFVTRRTNRRSQHSCTPSNVAYSSGVQVDGTRYGHMFRSGFASTKAPGYWSTTNRDETSSLYSSRPNSNVASPRPSTMHLPYSISRELRTPTVLSPSFATAESQIEEPSQVGENKAGNSKKPDVDPAIHSTAISDGADSPVANQTQRSQASSSNLSRTSKFVEDLDALDDKPVRSDPLQEPSAKKKRSGLNFFHFSRTGNRSFRYKILSFDGPADDSDQMPKNSIPLLPSHDEASEMWERALKAHANEKAAMWLKPDDHRGDLVSKRERRHSNSRSHASSNVHPSHQASAFYTPAHDSLDVDPFDNSKRRSSTPNLLKVPSATYVTQEQERAARHAGHPPTDSPNRQSLELSAWERFPSHTRPQRCGSAGPDDNVFPRDFGLSPFEETGEAQSEVAPDVQDPTNPDIKRFKKRISFGSRSGKSGKSIRRMKIGLPKSHSLNFGRKVLKHYASFFKPQSHEFFHYGHGHRSSVSTGGALENPELEIIRPVLPTFPDNKARNTEDHRDRDIELKTLDSSDTNIRKGKVKAVDGAWESTLQKGSAGQGKSTTEPTTGDDIEESLPFLGEIVTAGDSSGLDCEHFSDLEDSLQLSRSRVSSRKRKRLPSSQSEPVVDRKTSTRITSVASAWSKVYEDCVDHNLLQNRHTSHDDTIEEEAKGPLTYSACNSARNPKAKRNVHGSNKRTRGNRARRSSSGSGKRDAGPSRDTPSPPRTRNAKRLPLAPLKQGRIPLSSSDHERSRSPEDLAASWQTKGPALASSASAPILGKSEASFVEALKRNERIEKESVLQTAEELIV